MYVTVRGPYDVNSGSSSKWLFLVTILLFIPPPLAIRVALSPMLHPLKYCQMYRPSFLKPLRLDGFAQEVNPDNFVATHLQLIFDNVSDTGLCHSATKYSWNFYSTLSVFFIYTLYLLFISFHV